jgi:hypothetical protein
LGKSRVKQIKIHIAKQDYLLNGYGLSVSVGDLIA